MRSPPARAVAVPAQHALDRGRRDQAASSPAVSSPSTRGVRMEAGRRWGHGRNYRYADTTALRRAPWCGRAASGQPLCKLCRALGGACDTGVHTVPVFISRPSTASSQCSHQQASQLAANISASCSIK